VLSISSHSLSVTTTFEAVAAHDRPAGRFPPLDAGQRKVTSGNVLSRTDRRKVERADSKDKSFERTIFHPALRLSDKC
jgi:hypothetical protein